MLESLTVSPSDAADPTAKYKKIGGEVTWCGGYQPQIRCRYTDCQNQEKKNLPETNIAPENWWLEDYFPFGKASWEVLC